MLDAHPSGVVVHQVVTESGLQQSWLDSYGSPIVPNVTTSSGTPQVIPVTGSGFTSNAKARIIFNTPYANNGALAVRGASVPQVGITYVPRALFTITSSSLNQALA